VPDPERLTWRNFFLWLDRLHKFAEWFAEACKAEPSDPNYLAATKGRGQKLLAVVRPRWPFQSLPPHVR